MSDFSQKPASGSTEAPGPGEDHALGEAYRHLRIAIGLLALSLPFAVVIGKGLLDHSWDLQGSLSAYYYTRSRNYFIGALCALAVFFLSYEYRHVNEFRADNYLSNLASVAAVGVAFLPTTRGGVESTGAEKVVGALHYVSAVALFVTLGIFCLFLFTRSQGGETPQKKMRNRLYRACGWVIAGCLVLCAIALWTAPDSWRALFWLESIMVWAFAISWLVKGEFRGILADQPPQAAPPAAGPTA
ncbi:DUF998 domain-containing protein [Jatrophihabitans sp.]|uniref:DUF998 domain-containing protein n=1 Tax=Jatrophihabitans sp. TaxID=1932789 RepID=UPI002EF2B032